MIPPLVLAVDLGGTKLETALIDSSGRIQPGSRQRRPTGAHRSQNQVTYFLLEAVRASMNAATAPVTAAGIGSAGPVDLAVGSISPLNLPALAGYSVRSIVEDAAGVATALRLDGTCIALAEHWMGATRHARASMSIVVSTGVGGGIVTDGRLLSGKSGNAGHIGQIHVAAEPGHHTEDTTLEAVSSGPSTVRWARRHGWSGSTGEDLAVAVTQGDRIADTATRRSAAFVGQAIASAATLLDLEAVAIGGGFVAVRPDYIDLVRQSANRNAVLAYARDIRITASGLSGDGPLLGAAALWYHQCILSAALPEPGPPPR
ncbi:ROK family protein [Cryobacterium melibiosiphilum]|uniref:ROK family protein n=2 Tax=Cryobacterium melibiosiphilum TaxID=995039 RepID=A0A3A5MRM8_9MICO|nr:ROK family protein [Cryobacterium melibiosiphilum]